MGMGIIGGSSQDIERDGADARILGWMLATELKVNRIQAELEPEPNRLSQLESRQQPVCDVTSQRPRKSQP